MSSFIDLDSIWRDGDIYPNICDYVVIAKQTKSWSSSARDVSPLPANPNLRPLDFVSAIRVVSFQLPYPRIELFANKIVTVDSIVSNTLNSVANGLANGDILMTSTNMPSVGIQANVQYHVINAAADSFQLSLTSGGAAVTFTNGTGLDLPLSVVTTPVYTAFSNSLTLLSLPRLYLDFHCSQYKDSRNVDSMSPAIAGDAKFVLVQDKIIFDGNVPTWISYRSDMEQVMRYAYRSEYIFKVMTRDGTVLPFFVESDRTIPKDPQMQSLATFCITPYIRDNDYSNHEVQPVANA
jgi:hypothetical protein